VSVDSEKKKVPIVTAKLRMADKYFLEKMLEMESGYVLNFSNHTFAQFFAEEVGVDIDAPQYSELGGSKANRLRRFLQISDPASAARALRALWEYREEMRTLSGRGETIPNAKFRAMQIVEELSLMAGTAAAGVATDVNSCLDLIRTKAKAQFAGREKDYGRKVSNIVAKAAASRSLQSGGTLKALRDVAEEELVARAAATLETTKRVLESARHSGAIDALAAQARSLAATIVESAYAEIASRLRRLVEVTISSVPPGAIESAEFTLSTVRINQIENVNAEIDILTRELRADRPTTFQTTAPHSGRTFGAILFTDIVDSTPQAALIGDAAWREKMDKHDVVVRELVQQNGGRLIKTTGDGALATFGLPARAIACALLVPSALGSLGLRVRVGIHSGEWDEANADVSGIIVHIAQRVMSAATAGEVLVTEAVTEAVRGSHFLFESRGERNLKGITGAFRLFAAVQQRTK
jgi:class 3 adenylate cyclase